MHENDGYNPEYRDASAREDTNPEEPRSLGSRLSLHSVPTGSDPCIWLYCRNGTPVQRDNRAAAGDCLASLPDHAAHASVFTEGARQTDSVGRTLAVAGSFTAGDAWGSRRSLRPASSPHCALLPTRNYPRWQSAPSRKSFQIVKSKTLFKIGGRTTSACNSVLFPISSRGSAKTRRFSCRSLSR